MRDLSVNRYTLKPDFAALGILEKMAKDHGGTLECAFMQGNEDLMTGALRHNELSQGGMCFSFSTMWLRHKFEKLSDATFYQWLLTQTPGGVNDRNLRMSKWMQKQAFAVALGNQSRRADFQQFSANTHSEAYQGFMQQHPAKTFAGFVNHIGAAAQNEHGVALAADPRAEKGAYANTFHRGRYNEGVDASTYHFKQIEVNLDHSSTWQNIPVPAQDIYRHQLVASKISKNASKGNHLSKRERILNFVPKASLLPDPDGLRKRAGLAEVIRLATLEYQKQVKNTDVFGLIHTAKHVMAVYCEKSPVFGNCSLYFFDPNFGIFKFTNSDRSDRFDHFKKFLVSLLYFYNDNIRDFSLNLLGRA